MNVIIIAACIPTLRPLFLILFRQSSPSEFRPSRQLGKSSYWKHPSSDPNSNSSGAVPSLQTRASRALSKSNKAFDVYRNHTATGDSGSERSSGDKREILDKNAIHVRDTVNIESREVGVEDDRQHEWGARDYTGVPLREIRKPGEGPSLDGITAAPVDERFGVRGESMV